jgi:hypothetical protein
MRFLFFIFIMWNSLFGSVEHMTLDGGRQFSLMTPHASALDSSGYLHIVYGKDDLYHAWQNGSGWQTEVVDSIDGSMIGEYAAIAIDKNDKIHISYCDETSKETLYAHNKEGIWKKPIKSTTGVCNFSAIAVDSTGKVYTVDYRTTSQYPNGNGLRLVTYKKVSNHFSSSVTPLDPSADVDYCDMVIDSDDNVHLSYNDESTLQYIRYENEVIHKESVDVIGDAGTFNAIAVDSNNRPHISYYDHVFKNQLYATKNSSNIWVAQTVDSSSDVGKYSSIVIDNSNYAHISYFDESNTDLKYASNATGDWLNASRSTSNDDGYYTSIVALEDDITISYLDKSDYGLKVYKIIYTAPDSTVIS